MYRLFKKTPKSAGLHPGALVFAGEKKTEKVRITVIVYDETNFQEKEVNSTFCPAECGRGY